MVFPKYLLIPQLAPRTGAKMADLAGDSAHADALADMRATMPADWDAETVERQVLLSQARRKIARCKNVCKDIGW